MRRFPGIFLCLAAAAGLQCAEAAAADAPLPAAPAPSKFVGEMFGRRVPRADYDFAAKTFSIFSMAKAEATTEEAKRAEVWKQLVFEHEADLRGIQIAKEDVQKELERLLAEKNVQYGSLAYFDFIQSNFGEDAQTFERRMEGLLKVKALLNGILNPPPPVIKDEDAKQKFLNQYNSMNVDMVRFDTLPEAQAFFKKMTGKKWDEEKKKNPKFATPTGHISLEALIDLWKVPFDDAYRVHKLAIGKIAAPVPMYKGYGVFRVTEKKDADPKIYDDKKKQEYVKVLKQVYYYEKSQKQVDDIAKRAALKDFDMDKVVVFETTAGPFEVQLYPSVAPKAVENFMGLAAKGYYNGLLFHRVIKGFMIQGGDPKGDGTGGESIWGKPFEDEVRQDVQFEKSGIIAMANSGPNTNGSQFFVTVRPAPQLNMKHTIFGEVISGYETVAKIDETETGANDRPKTDQKMLKVYPKVWPAD